MRLALMGIVLVSVFSLTGCVSARQVPPPMSDAELQSYLEDRVDAAWANTGLDGTVARPESDPATYLERYRGVAGAEGFSGCLQNEGVSGWGVTEQNDGPVFTGQTGQSLEPAEELVFYQCFAANPSDASFGQMMLSPEESEYLYDYYRDWVVPCLTLEGVHVAFVPSREEYLAGSSFGWIPYYVLEPGLSGEDPYGDGGAAMFDLAKRCGDPFPGMPYGEQYGF